MAMALPLCADISNHDGIALNDSSALLRPQFTVSPAGEFVDLLPSDTQSFSILDTREPLNTTTHDVAFISGNAAAGQTSGSLAPVPEPMHYALMGLGLVGLYLARRDRLSAK